ncbi:protein CURVATURE THYLAKOID 1C, chloroplastic isoform X4 [Neltuma alba]|uniref:protein CURVATURE THYLAKOID 1C, chloroplastic isoform X4 n=1 Tax=Neltuma alba TaxID=207710 RepID=UPI0010A35222|nr:protein CURVATURE THYLAKOID 1C, chloroplastic-like isoform X4 [Prosopis alba]
MASITANLPPALLVHGVKPFSGNLKRSPIFLVPGRQNHPAGLFTVKATGESSESSTSLTVIKSVQNVAIDKLPLIPGLLELIGILFSSWFTYRYLLFKPDRQELYQILNKSISDILG